MYVNYIGHEHNNSLLTQHSNHIFINEQTLILLFQELKKNQYTFIGINNIILVAFPIQVKKKQTRYLQPKLPQVK